jgi:hypothetical protein
MKIAKIRKSYRLSVEIDVFCRLYAQEKRRGETDVVEMAVRRFAKAEGYDLEKLRESVLE